MSIRSRLFPWFAVLPFLGCTNGTAGGAGEVSFVVADAASDEVVQFEVDIASVVLTSIDGTTINVLPRATRVDFADLHSVGELIHAQQLTAGTYVSLTMNLDFSTAAVAILGQTGPASVVDASGVPITTLLPVQVDFALRSRPLIRSGRHHLFQIDLDLDQALTVDSGANEVTFAPVLSAVVDPTSPRPATTTGILTAVDTVARTFAVERRALDGNALATWTVQTANLSVFQVDGVVSLGATGLAAMQAHVGERVFTQGTLDVTDRVIFGAMAEVGAGVPGNGQDWVVGHVTGRNNGAGSDAALTVVGRSLDVGTGTRRYNVAHTVNVSFANTKVLRRGAGNLLDTDAINVGQLVLVFGDLSGTTMDATASTGVVRMLHTRVFGTATGPVSGGRLTLNLARFDLRLESAFNFTVGGTSQADHNAYTVEVGTLPLAGITTGSKIEATAWINPVGNSVDADSEALSILDRSSGGRALLLQWGTPSPTAIAATTATSITVNLPGATIATVGDGFAPVAVTSSPSPTLVPLASTGLYRIVLGEAVGVHFTFDTFRRALVALNTTHSVFRIAALGTYDPSTQAFSAATATVVLQ